MRRISAIAILLGAAALAAPLLVDRGMIASPPAGQPEARVLASATAPGTTSSASRLRAATGPALPAEAKLEAARQALAATRPEADAAGFARALRALEGTLLELRAGAANADGKVRSLKHALRSEDAELKRLLASLASASLARSEHMSPLHPAGPVGGARAMALIPASYAALRAGAAAAGVKFAAIANAERQGRESRESLAAGLATAGEARDALRTEMLSNAEAAPPGPPDPSQPNAVIARGSDTLSDLAAGLAGPVPPQVARAAEVAIAAIADLVATDARVTRSSRNLPGSEPALMLEMPITGSVLRGFKAPDGAGVPRPGLTLAAAPRSLVTAPIAGEVRYVGPFLDWNRVVAIAPADDVVVLLAGLAEVAVGAGDIVAAGAPVGFLGGRDIGTQEFLMLTQKGNDAFGTETLYMELWREGEPVDPGPWLGSRTDMRNE